MIAHHLIVRPFEIEYLSAVVVEMICADFFHTGVAGSGTFLEKPNFSIEYIQAAVRRNAMDGYEA